MTEEAGRRFALRPEGTSSEPSDGRAHSRADERREALEALVDELDERFGEPDPDDVERFRQALS